MSTEPVTFSDPMGADQQPTSKCLCHVVRDLLVLSQDGRTAYNYIPFDRSKEEVVSEVEYGNNITMSLDWFFTMLSVLRLDEKRGLFSGYFRHSAEIKQWETPFLKENLPDMVERLAKMEKEHG